MALINCPECNTQVSDKAEKCPNCAFPIKTQNKKEKIESEGCFLQTLNFGCAMAAYGVIGIILIIIFAAIFS